MYHTFTSTRQTEPFLPALIASLRAAIDPSVGLSLQRNAEGALQVLVKKATDWASQEITTAQALIDSAPVATEQLRAQHAIDRLSVAEKAVILTLLDEINVLRVALSLPARTRDQALQAIRNKAGTL